MSSNLQETRPIPWPDLLEAGKKAYEDKRYVDALAAFDEALPSIKQIAGPDALLRVLDQRVGVHVKLGNLDLARQDAKSMIRTNKADARGYLRSGQLERLKHDYQAALKWYDHGLKHVPTSDHLHQYIEIQRLKTTDLTNKRVVFSNPKDPLSTLPAELAQLMVLFLDYKQVVIALRVSKDWQRTLTRMRPILDTVDFRGSRRVINYQMMKAGLKRLARDPRVLHMTKLSEPAAKLLKLNLDRWINYTHLEHLSFSSHFSGLAKLPFARYILKSLLLGDQDVLGDETVMQILKDCKSLEVARFAKITAPRRDLWRLSWGNLSVCHNMRSLDLRGAEGSLVLVEATSFLLFPRLRELECHNLMISEVVSAFDELKVFDLSSMHDLRKVVFANCTIDFWPKLPSTVQFWDNESCQVSPGLNFPPGHLTQLEDLRVARFAKCWTTPNLLQFLPRKPLLPLHELDVQDSFLDPSDFIELAEAGALQNLKVLRLGGSNSDTEVVPFLDRLKGLEKLYLDRSAVTGVEIAALLTAPDSCLHYIQLRDCDLISSDVYEWARKRGVVVDVKKTASSERKTGLWW